MKHIEDHIRNRRSVRTFDGKALRPTETEALKAFMEKIDNPFGIPVEFQFLDAKEHGLLCPVVSGTEQYVAGKIKQVPYANEAFGYSFETLVLYAQSLGIGTVWLGGTMNRSAFEEALNLGADEMMPCASPLGYPAAKMSLKETMMRKAINANERLPFEKLFFDNSFNTSLTKETAGRLLHPLSMVRLAPSAVNKQPWRVVVTDTGAHFYLKRNKGFSSSAVDMQKIDMGIALCHFDLAAKEMDLKMTFAVNDPHMMIDSDLEYIASYLYNCSDNTN